MYRKFLKKISAQSTIRYLLKILLLSFIYYITGGYGLNLGAVSTFATPVWPPTGIAFAALLLFGLELWPGVALGAFIVNFITGAPIPVAAGIASGNTLEAVAGVVLLQKFTINAPNATTSLLLGNKIV